MPTTTTTTLSLSDLLRLGSMHDHSYVRAARARVADAQQAVDAVERAHAEAQAERTAAEAAAADGRRDDRRLARAQTQLDSTASDLRIATLALDRAREAVAEAFDTACRDVDRQLHDLHRAAVAEFHDALREAKRCNDALARLEDCSAALFRGGMYRKTPGSPLTEASWRKEFGGPGPGSTSETRYDYWRKFWKFA